MSAPAAPKGGLLSRFRRGKEGSVAIEFGMLALPFALVVFAVLESCISFAAQQLMSNATDDIARQFRTGAIKTISEDDLKKKICAEIGLLAGSESSCTARMDVDVRAFNTFSDANAVRIRVVNKQLDKSGFAVNPGGTGTRNMLRVFYRWPTVTNFMQASMSNLNSGEILHVATAVWK
ncbi:pilus assembly protein, partial [Escherichia coli]|nr:pilus assembly protein [Escherichia coli]